MLPSGPEVPVEPFERLKLWWRKSELLLLPLATVVAIALYGDAMDRRFLLGLLLSLLVASGFRLYRRYTLAALKRQVIELECWAAREELILIERWLPGPSVPGGEALREKITKIMSEGWSLVRDLKYKDTSLNTLIRDGVYAARGHWGQDWPADRLPEGTTTTNKTSCIGQLYVYEQWLALGDSSDYRTKLHDRNGIANAAYVIWLKTNEKIDALLNVWRSNLINDGIQIAYGLHDTGLPKHIEQAIRLLEEVLRAEQQLLPSDDWRTCKGQKTSEGVLKTYEALQGFREEYSEPPPQIGLVG